MSILNIIKEGYTKRYYGIGSQLIEVTHDNDTGIDVISMASPPVNILNTELLHALKTYLLEARNNDIKGIVLTSSLPNIFSAGLNLWKIISFDESQLTNYLNLFQDIWLTLYGLDIPIAAAINSFCFGGGCLLAIATEYRVFVEGEHTIGLNETQLGVSISKYFIYPYISLLGYRQAELALLKGSQFKPEEALRIGFVDELAIDKADAIEKCKNYILSYNNIPSMGRTVAKMDLRNDLIQRVKEDKESTKAVVKFMQLPKVQATLKQYMKHLKQNKL